MASRAALLTLSVNCIPNNSSWARLLRAISTSRKEPGKWRVFHAWDRVGIPAKPGNTSSKVGQNSFK